jgi:heat shock protein HtpX
MFALRLRMYLLLILMFAIVYAIASMLSRYLFGITNFNFYLILSLVMMFIQYMIGPKLVEWSMQVKYVQEKDYPELFQMVRGLSVAANIPMPRIGISQVNLPNAFAFGRWKKDGRVCVTQGILKLLEREELRAVLGHEITHLKNRDVLTITLLSIIPTILYRIAWSTMYSRGYSRDRRDSANTALIGILAFLFYFLTNLLVLYASRIREYFADRGSVSLGNPAHNLASALYKLVYGSAKTSKEDLQQVEGLKAFFVNDPSAALREIRELKDLDRDHSGSIDASELLYLRTKEFKVSFGQKLMEILSTHPNMLKRIKQLSNYERL